MLECVTLGITNSNEEGTVNSDKVRNEDDITDGNEVGTADGDEECNTDGNGVGTSVNVGVLECVTLGALLWGDAGIL